MKNRVETESVAFATFENLRRVQDMSGVTPITLDFCGSEQCEPCYGYGPTIRPVYILHVIAGGRGRLEKDGRVYPLEAGQCFLIYPGEENYYEADAEDPWTYLWIGFHGFHAEEMMERAGFSRKKPWLPCPDMGKVCGHMKEMLRCSKLTYTNELRRLSALYQLVAEFVDAEETVLEEEPLPASPSGDVNHQYVQAAINLLSVGYGTQIRVADVAKTIGISRNYLDEIFRREMGISPKEFLMSFRMEKASALLKHTGNPIGIIAAEVGYSDPMTFSKIFRSRFGMSPSQFREASRSESVMDL